MNDLISREMVLKTLTEPNYYDICDKSKKEFKSLIVNTPTIEAVPVVHGEWLINTYGYYLYCSACKVEPNGGHLTNFCQNCGADMRKKVE